MWLEWTVKKQASESLSQVKNFLESHFVQNYYSCGVHVNYWIFHTEEHMTALSEILH